MKITDPGFQDFRSDASCLIRPQSLIGEKFVDCHPTLPRAPGSPPAAAAEADPLRPARRRPVPAAAGEQQHQRRPGPDQRHPARCPTPSASGSSSTNSAPASPAAARTSKQSVKRANPVLRDVDRALRHPQRPARPAGPARLATRRQILGPLSRERAHVAGFFANAGAAAQASSERGADLEASLRKFPAFLREFRLTMRSLQGFSDAATPVFTDLGKAAPSLTEATRELTPFSAASTVSLKSLGATGEVAGPILRDADPIVSKTTRTRPQSGAGPTTELANFLVSIKETEGLGRPGRPDLQHDRDRPTDSTSTATSLRSLVSLTNCLEYEVKRIQQLLGQVHRAAMQEPRRFNSAELARVLAEEQATEGGGTLARPSTSSAAAAPSTESSPPASGPALSQGHGLGNKATVPSPRAGAPSSTTSWGHEEPRRHTGSGEQPGPGRRGHRAGRHRRRLPRLQRQQRAALRLHLQPQGPACPTPTPWSRATRCGSAASASASSSRSCRSSSATARVAAELSAQPRQERRTAAGQLDDDHPAQIGARPQVPADRPRQLLARASPPAKRSRSPPPGPNRSTSTSSSTCSTKRPGPRSSATWPASATPSPAAARSSTERSAPCALAVESGQPALRQPRRPAAPTSAASGGRWRTSRPPLPRSPSAGQHLRRPRPHLRRLRPRLPPLHPGNDLQGARRRSTRSTPTCPCCAPSSTTPSGSSPRSSPAPTALAETSPTIAAALRAGVPVAQRLADPQRPAAADRRRAARLPERPRRLQRARPADRHQQPAAARRSSSSPRRRPPATT